MRTIYKYPVNLSGETNIAIPGNALFRHFAEQDGRLYLWVEVRTDLAESNRTYVVVGTGQKIPMGSEWKGTCFSGPFVWHLYEL